ncbi:unnamed protein product, partial [Effrenium voratum]
METEAAMLAFSRAWRRPGLGVPRRELQGMRDAGTFKVERVIQSPQGGSVTVAGGSGPVLNFCANNYLGLSSHPALVKACELAHLFCSLCW